MSDGAVAACGLAQGMDLPMTVAPFILRGVSLLGINSVYCPQQRRIKLWERISKDLDRDKLASITNVIEFDDALDAAPKILEGKIRGRTVVRIG